MHTSFTPKTTLWSSAFYQQIRSVTTEGILQISSTSWEIVPSSIKCNQHSHCLLHFANNNNKISLSELPWTYIIPSYTNCVGWRLRSRRRQRILTQKKLFTFMETEVAESKSLYLAFKSEHWLPKVELNGCHVVFWSEGLGDMKQ